MALEILAVALCCDLVCQNGGSQTSQQQAAEIVRLMTARQLSTIAAADPREDGWFVAAMHIPGSQLLVIRAQYPAPSLLRERILSGDFRQSYTDLHSAGALDARLFVIDSGADGLKMHSPPNQPFDITWRDGRAQTMLNGEWKDQKLTSKEYQDRFARQEAAYAEMLAVLIASLKPEN